MTFRRRPERLMYVQFTSCVQGEDATKMFMNLNATFYCLPLYKNYRVDIDSLNALKDIFFKSLSQKKKTK